jgi:hypothetical protein
MYSAVRLGRTVIIELTAPAPGPDPWPGPGDQLGGDIDQASTPKFVAPRVGVKLERRPAAGCQARNRAAQGPVLTRRRRRGPKQCNRRAFARWPVPTLKGAGGSTGEIEGTGEDSHSIAAEEEVAYGGLMSWKNFVYCWGGSVNASLLSDHPPILHTIPRFLPTSTMPSRRRDRMCPGG